MLAIAIGSLIWPPVVWYFLIMKPFEAIALKAGFEKSCGRMVAFHLLLPVIVLVFGGTLVDRSSEGWKHVAFTVFVLSLVFSVLGLLSALMRFAYKPWPVLQAQSLSPPPQPELQP